MYKLIVKTSLLVFGVRIASSCGGSCRRLLAGWYAVNRSVLKSFEKYVSVFGIGIEYLIHDGRCSQTRPSGCTCHGKRRLPGGAMASIIIKPHETSSSKQGPSICDRTSVASHLPVCLVRTNTKLIFFPSISLNPSEAL